MKKRVLITTANEGHKSIALAVKQVLENNYQVKLTPDTLFIKHNLFYQKTYQTT